MPRPKPLSCGGKGPCCHVGYAHRHCEHCDVVIDLRTYHDFLPWRPYQQPYIWWTTNTAGSPARVPAFGEHYNTFGDVHANAADDGASAFVRALNSAASPNRSPMPSHVCEVN